MRTSEGSDVLTLYGIPNCDTCRKARRWLSEHSVEYRFHDLRVDGLERATLERWVDHAGWKKLLNTRSTTWRNIPAAARENLDRAKALTLLLENPTLVKRPVVVFGARTLVGFDANIYTSSLNRKLCNIRSLNEL